MRVLFDLTGANEDVRFSPFCFRVKIALMLKGLDYTVERTHLTDKAKLAFSGQGLVPVLKDGEHVVSDSWKILQFLDEHYPASDAGLPFATKGHFGLGARNASAATEFLRQWCDRTLHPALFRVAAPYIHECLTPPDQAYFRATREARLGKSLEAIASERDKHVAVLQLSLEPLRGLLQTQDFVDGAIPGLGDVLIYSAWLWADAVVPFALLEETDAVALWLARLRAHWPVASINR